MHEQAIGIDDIAPRLNTRCRRRAIPDRDSALRIGTIGLHIAIIETNNVTVDCVEQRRRWVAGMQGSSTYRIGAKCKQREVINDALAYLK